jgi:hypothetical protein
MMAFRVVRERGVLYLDTPLEPQFHKPNRLWAPGSHGRLTGHTHRTPTGDNFDTPGGASSLRRAS